MTDEKEKFSTEIEDLDGLSASGFESDLNYEKILWIQMHRTTEALSGGTKNCWNAVSTFANLLSPYFDEEYENILKKIENQYETEVKKIKEEQSGVAANAKIESLRINLAGNKFKELLALLKRAHLLLKGKLVARM